MLTLRNIVYRIDGRLILNGATADVPDGARIGLVGRNGAGKSTLFRLIRGAAEPESGEIHVPRGWRVGGVDQEVPGDDRRLIDTVLAADVERARLLAESENARDPHRIAEIHTRLADISAHGAEGRAAQILKGLGFDEDAQQRPCRSFSGGWRMRAALAAMLFAEPDLLLLDEPTNYLDLEGTLWLTRHLARYARAMIIVSHDRDLLNEAVRDILHLEGGALTPYAGGWDAFDRQRRERAMQNVAAKRKQEAVRKHLQSFVDRFRYKASKARQAQSRLKMLERMEPIADAVSERVAPILFPAPAELAPPLATLQDVAVGYAPGQPVLRRLSLRLDPDDRIALVGPNGEGKSTFAKLLAGRLQPESGEMTISSKLKVGYFAQHQLDELGVDDSPFQHLARRMQGVEPAKVRARLGAFGFGADKADTPCGALSGGEKARLLLCLAAFDAPNLLILDEPTNHLDVESRDALVTALNDYPGAVLMIAHDPHLIAAAADRIWRVGGGTIRVFDGDIDDYRDEVLAAAGAARREARAERARGEDGDDAASGNRKSQRRAAAEARARLQPMRRKVEAAEKRVAALEAERAKLEAALADPALYQGDGARLAALTADMGRVQKALNAAEDAWLAAQEAYDAAEAAEDAL